MVCTIIDTLDGKRHNKQYIANEQNMYYHQLYSVSFYSVTFGVRALVSVSVRERVCL